MDDRKASCPWRDVHENIKEDIGELKEDVRVIRRDVSTLLRFKWQIMGGTAVITFVTMTVIALIGALK